MDVEQKHMNGHNGNTTHDHSAQHRKSWLPAVLLLLALACVPVVLGLMIKWLELWSGFGTTIKPALLGNDVNPILAWHPVAMFIAFGILMATALPAFRLQLPLYARLPRRAKKAVHTILHTLAGVFMAFGLAAAIYSQGVANPERHQWYNVHNYLGVTAVGLYVVQYLVGFYAFVWPGKPLTDRAKQYLAYWHTFAGFSIWTLGMATALTGVQELQTLIYIVYQGTLGAYWPTIRLASIMALFMAFMTLMILMYFWVLATYPPRKRPAADATATV